MAKQTFTAGQVLTAAQVNALQGDIYNQTVSTKVANYTLVAADAGTRLVGNGTSITFTVNNSLFTAGDTLKIHNINSTALTIAAGAGVTINAAAGLTISQYQEAVLFATSASSFILFESTASSAQGLTLLSTTSFSAVSSQLITVFSSTYANYKMIMDISASTGMTLTARYSASGTPYTSANYSYAVYGLTSGNASVNIAAASQTSFSLATMAWDTEEYEMTIYKPNLATRTCATWQKTGINSGSTPSYFTGGAILDNGTQFDQIQLLPSTGTITGTVRTYGFNQ